jgi:hypothetical protein
LVATEEGLGQSKVESESEAGRRHSAKTPRAAMAVKIANTGFTVPGIMYIHAAHVCPFVCF